LSHCPPNPDDLADAYLMGHMPDCEVVTYELHFLACLRCAERLEKTRNLIEIVRAPVIRPCESVKF
jgi:hypothetical protein